jgi:hypothetical protein
MLVLRKGNFGLRLRQSIQRQVHIFEGTLKLGDTLMFSRHPSLVSYAIYSKPPSPPQRRLRALGLAAKMLFTPSPKRRASKPTLVVTTAFD